MPINLKTEPMHPKKKHFIQNKFECYNIKIKYLNMGFYFVIPKKCHLMIEKKNICLFFNLRIDNFCYSFEICLNCKKTH